MKFLIWILLVHIFLIMYSTIQIADGYCFSYAHVFISSIKYNAIYFCLSNQSLENTFPDDFSIQLGWLQNKIIICWFMCVRNV